MFNSTIMAYDGLTFVPLWSYMVSGSEVISVPIPGYYNDDDIPDFMIKHQIGAGFPTYYYTVTTIVDGRNGQPLLEKPMEDSLSKQMSGLSITVDGFGNDWFLHWSADCLYHEGVKEKYQFLKGQSLVSQTRADLCRLRFNSTLTTRLLALSQHVGPPGLSLYFSEDWKTVEYNNSIDPRREAEKFLDSHPRLDIVDTYADMPLVSERSPRVHKNHEKESIFKHKGNGLLSELDENSDAVYENFNDFKNRKKPPESVVDDDAAANLDRAWKQDNKWTVDNVQSDKEYDGLYGGDNGNDNDDGEPSIDYSQAEVREQRSVVTEIRPSDPYLINMSHEERDLKKIDESTWRNTRLNKNDAERKRGTPEVNGETKQPTNVSTGTPEPQEMSTSNASSSESNYEEITTTVSNTLNASSVITDESNETRNTSLDLEMTSEIETSSITEDQRVASSRDISSTEWIVAATQPTRQIYKHSFPNIVQDADDDASIEKVFKRESLKNQNKDRRSRGRSILSSLLIANENGKAQQKRRTRRQSDGRDDQLKSTINGIQRQSPTGILLPSIAESSGGRSSVDLVFSTFWLPSSEVSLILSQADLECIYRKKVLSENKLQYRKDDDIVSECLSERGVDYRLYQESTDRENTKIALGQMTVYRMKLECVCPEDMLPNQTCRNISSHQSWPEHLGSSGNGYFKPLRKTNV